MHADALDLAAATADPSVHPLWRQQLGLLAAKTQQTPDRELKIARRRVKELHHV